MRTPSRVLAALKTTVRQQERPRATIGSMNTDRELVTAAQLDAMSPNQRAATVAEHIVTGLAELSPAFRDQVLATGRRLVAERTQAAG